MGKREALTSRKTSFDFGAVNPDKLVGTHTLPPTRNLAFFGKTRHCLITLKTQRNISRERKWFSLGLRSLPTQGSYCFPQEVLRCIKRRRRQRYIQNAFRNC